MNCEPQKICIFSPQKICICDEKFDTIEQCFCCSTVWKKEASYFSKMRICPSHNDLAPTVMWYETYLLCEPCTKEYKIVPEHGKSYSTGPFVIEKIK